MMDVFEADSPYRHHAAKYLENIRIFDLVIREVAAGTHLIKLRYAHKLPNARQSGISEGGLIADFNPVERTKFNCANRHHPRLAGEKLTLFCTKSTYRIH
jgi:hypothetical protein